MLVNPLVIKKYPNRRLYDTESSGYITLADVATALKRGRTVSVVESKTGADLTEVTLLNVLVAAAESGTRVMSVQELVKLIREHV